MIAAYVRWRVMPGFRLQDVWWEIRVARNDFVRPHDLISDTLPGRVAANPQLKSDLMPLR